jgi:AcrR family transcriptional regulator
MAYRNDTSPQAKPSPATNARRRRAPRRTAAGAATRERILGAAERLFAERGFSGVSMPAVAQAAGITAGAIYKHFESKEQLFFMIVRRAVQAAPATTAAAGRSGAAAIGAVVAAYATRRLKRVRQLAVETHHAAAQNVKVRRILRASVDREISEMTEAIAAGQRAGAFDAALDPGLTACMIMTLIMGLMHTETLTPQMVGDGAWRTFIEVAVERLLTSA